VMSGEIYSAILYIVNSKFTARQAVTYDEIYSLSDFFLIKI